MKRRNWVGIGLLLALLLLLVISAVAETTKTITYYYGSTPMYFTGKGTYTPGAKGYFHLPKAGLSDYHFVGWHKEKDLSDDEINGFWQNKESDDLKFYVEFEKCSGSYTLTFCDENGDPMKDKDGNALPAYTYCAEETPKLPEADELPEQEGKSFVGWFDSVTGGNRITDSYLMDALCDLQIYARYTAPEKIYYVYGGKTYDLNQTYTPGRNMMLKLNQILTTSSFLIAWHLEEDLSDEGFLYLNQSEHEGALTLYPEFEKAYLIYYYYFDEEANQFKLLRDENDKYITDKYNANHPLVQLQSMENTETEGFSGWYLNKDYTGESYYSLYRYTAGDELKTLYFYARYMPIHTVTYMDGDTVLSITGEQYTKYWYRAGATQPLPTLKDKEDSYFVGWHQQADLSDEVQTAAFSCEQDEDLTFYAEYKTFYTVTYMDGDTVLSIEGDQYTKYKYQEGVTQPLPEPPAKKNSLFVGWHEQNDLSDEAQTESFSCEQNKNLIFYAEYYEYLPAAWTLNLNSGTKGNKARLTIPTQSDEVTWTSSDTKVVTASGNSSSVLLTAKKAGTVIVTLQVGDNAVAECAVTVRAIDHVLNVPKSLTKIKASAFERNAVEAIVLADSVREIGSRAFANCQNLVYIYIPDSVQSIAPDAFDGISPIIYCTAGSTAAEYADNNGLNWAEIK